VLSRWRGKKILFVGDSISLNQWESLVCMLHAAAPASRTTYSRGTPVSSVTFQVRAPPYIPPRFWCQSLAIFFILPLHQHRTKYQYYRAVIFFTLC
jgi:hypothetical protein